MVREPEEILEDNGYDIEILKEEGTLFYRNFDYASAIVGISDDSRIVYNYELMVQHLVLHEGFTEDEAREWIDYNTLRAYTSEGKMPIVMYPIEQ